MKAKRTLLLSLALCCILVLGMLPVAVSAATSDPNPQPFTFDVDKIVTKGGDAAPGEETFTFELEYGTVGENEQHSVVFTPDDSVTLADCGIAFTNDTITTDGEGEHTFTLGGTVDLSMVSIVNHWQAIEDNSGEKKLCISLRLTEKDDGKAGWTYSDAERYLTLTVTGNEISAAVSILGNDVFDNDFENVYAAYSFTVKKTDADGNPLAGAVFALNGTESTAVQSFEATSGTDGIAVFNVPEGNYTLSEKTAPEGYVKSDETYTLAVRSDIDHTAMDWGGEPGVYFFDENEPDYSNYKYIRYQQVTFVNEAAVVSVPTVEFTVNKTDADGNPLAGATFSLTGTGNSVGNDFEAVSGNDGIAVFEVPEGFYTLSEKTAPEGYVKSDESYGIAIWNGVVHFYDEAAETDDDRYSEYEQVTFVNNAAKPAETPPESSDSPQTGSNGMMYLWIALLLVSGLSAAGITVYSRKKNHSAK